MFPLVKILLGRFMTLRKIVIFLGVIALICVPTIAVALVYYAIDDGNPSICYGNAIHGRLENGKRLPYAGKNYRAYHIAGFLTGRTFVHSAVRDTMRDSYAALAESDPELRFVYAEIGWPTGGRFRPHRTHANGTSVDFMVPLRNEAGEVVELHSSVTNMLGYAVKFDDKGQRKDQQIDFEAMAKHLLALDKAARANGIGIRRVIFEPPLLPQLFATPSGQALKGRMNFMNRRAWVRHDQHYHVDFAVRCRKG